VAGAGKGPADAFPMQAAVYEIACHGVVMKKLNVLDLYDFRGQLSEEEVMVQDTVARFVDEAVLPIIGECFEHARFPAELVPQIAEQGLLGSSIEGYDCAGLNGVCYGLICQELERGDRGIRSFV